MILFFILRVHFDFVFCVLYNKYLLSAIYIQFVLFRIDMNNEEAVHCVVLYTYMYCIWYTDIH